MKLFRFEKEFGRMGSIEGVFACTEEEMRKVQNWSVYYDDVLGKHSEVEFTVAEACCEELDIPENLVEVLVKAIGSKTISGFNLVQDAEEQNVHLKKDCEEE